MKRIFPTALPAALPAALFAACASAFLLTGCQSNSAEPGVSPPMESDEAGSPRDPQPAPQRGSDEAVRIPMG